MKRQEKRPSSMTLGTVFPLVYQSGSWKTWMHMASDSGPPQLKIIIAPTTAIMPDVAFFLKQIVRVFDTWCPAFYSVWHSFPFLRRKRTESTWPSFDLDGGIYLCAALGLCCLPSSLSQSSWKKDEIWKFYKITHHWSILVILGVNKTSCSGYLWETCAL